MNRIARTLVASAAAAAGAAACLPPSAARADEVAGLAAAPDAPAGPTVVTMTVHPQPTTRPALRNRVIPALVDQTPGDAAPVYLVAALLANRENDPFAKPVTDEDARRFGLPAAEGRDWTSLFLDAPLAKLPSADLDKYVNAQETVIRHMEIASRRETCRWDLPLREQGFAALLPHLQALRAASRSVAVKARAELARGDPEAALRTLRSNFALARALNQQAVVIQSLVAAAVGAQALKLAREAAELPNCPNLYWPLSDLPTPLVDIRSGLEWERWALQFTIPQLSKARDGTLTDDDWRAMIRQFALLGRMEPQTDGRWRMADEMGVATAAMLMFPQARKHLIDTGRPAAAVDAMPPTAVIARYLVDTYDELYDELTKWANLPYWQGRAGAVRAKAEFARRAAGGAANPLFVIVPAVDRAAFSVRKLERDVAATRAVEALRAHVAAHGGAIPKALAEVTDTPVPLDPMTGQPFAYKVDGRTVTLESPAPEGERPQDGLVMKVTIAR